MRREVISSVDHAKTIVVTLALITLVQLHVLDRSSSRHQEERSTTPPSTAHAATASTAVRALHVECGGSTRSAIEGADQIGSFVVASDAPVHGDVVACTVFFVAPRTVRCSVTPGLYTVISGRGQIDIVGPSPGETVRYACN